MTTTGLFLTTANLAEDSGGGKVSLHELAAMTRKVSDVTVLQQKDLALDGLPFHPMLQDYVAWYKTGNDIADYIFVNGAPFGCTVQHLINKDTKVIIDVPAHNLKDSIDEHHALGAPYERMYPHMVKPDLWDMMNLDRRLANTIVCPSNYSVQEIKKIVQFNSKTEFVVIPHGTDLPARTEPLPPTTRFGYAGSAGPDKGVIYLLKAWNTYGFTDAELAVAGKHSEDIRNFALQLAPQNGGKYKWLGYQQKMDDFYNGIHVYVQPSVTEGFGLEVLEAMAHGRPVIVSDGCGASELVDDGINGFVFKKRDVKDLAEKIAYFMDNPADVVSMGQNARAKAEAYSWNEIEKQYEGLFEK